MSGQEKTEIIKIVRILVFGSAGNLGSHVVKELVSGAHSVVGVDRREATDDLLDGYHCVDLSQASVLELNGEVFDSAIVLAAALPSHGSDSWVGEQNKKIYDNVLATLRRTQIEALVYVSSSAVYDPRDEVPLTGSSKVNPRTEYAKSKLYGEEIFRDFSESRGIPFACFRPLPIIGPAALGFFDALHSMIRRGIPVPVPIPCQGKLQFTSGKLLVEMIAGIPENLDSGVILVGSPEPRSICDYVADVGDIVGRKPRVVKIPKNWFRTLLTTANWLGLTRLGSWHADMLINGHQVAMELSSDAEETCAELLRGAFQASTRIREQP